MNFKHIKEKLIRDLPTPDSSPQEVAEYCNFSQRVSLALIELQNYQFGFSESARDHCFVAEEELSQWELDASRGAQT